MTRAIVLLAAGIVAGAGASAVSAQAPAPAGAQPRLFVGKIWLSTDAAAAPGTLRVFLPDGTLVMTSCTETYRLARWTPVDETRIVWQEDPGRVEAEIAHLTSNELQLRLRLVNGTRVEHYRLAQAPYVCPELRAGPQGADLRVEGTLTYLESLTLPPSATVLVELRDATRADAAVRPLATQTIPASQGPPFRFSLSVPRARIDPRASLSLHAEIRDGSRLMFVTISRHAVPQNGAAGVEVRLTFVDRP